MVANRSLKWILSACLLLSACRSFVSDSPTPAPVTSTPVGIQATQPPATPTTVPNYVANVRNADYQLGAANVPRTVQLTDGKYEKGSSGSADYASVTVTDFMASGDLNADGTNEIAALIAENYGGSGTYVFLAVYSMVNGKAVFQTSILVDDRPELNSLSINDNQIFVDAVIHATADPMCCPTLKTTRHYRFTNGQLVMTDYRTFTTDGTARMIAIESPVNGAEVSKTILIKGNVTVAPFENNLTYRILDGVGVELAVGSISVSASNPGGPGTFDAAIKLGNALSNARVRLEVQDVSAADGSLLAMDSVELVVK